jgi:hypothetical protein
MQMFAAITTDGISVRSPSGYPRFGSKLPYQRALDWAICILKPIRPVPVH